MTATNHALTGAAVGFLIGNPAVALPAALASHYVCDALPHFGVTAKYKRRLLRSNAFRNYLLLEALICLGLVLVLAALRPAHWSLAALCAFAAAAPDLLSYNRYSKSRQRKAWRPGIYSRFAHGIQWFERPIGAAVEIAWAVAALSIVWPFIR